METFQIVLKVRRGAGVQKTLRFCWRMDRKKSGLKASSPLEQINNQDDERDSRSKLTGDSVIVAPFVMTRFSALEWFHRVT